MPWQLPVGVKPSARVKKASNATVRAQADFRNQAFLNTFISELGKLPPKRTTRLQNKTHRHLCRQIKVRPLPPIPLPCHNIQLSRTKYKCSGRLSCHTSGKTTLSCLDNLASFSAIGNNARGREACSRVFQGCVRMQLARQMALLPIDSRLKPAYLARAGGLAEVPSTIEYNAALAHLLPPHRRPAPREF